MGAADGTGNINTKSDGQTPPNDDVGVATLDDFAGNCWITAEKDNHGNNTVAEQDQDHRSEELCYKLLTFSKLHCANYFLGGERLFSSDQMNGFIVGKDDTGSEYCLQHRADAFANE
jgi:hypothetical protein